MVWLGEICRAETDRTRSSASQLRNCPFEDLPAPSYENDVVSLGTPRVAMARPIPVPPPETTT